MVNILDCLGIQELLTMMQTSHAMLGFAKETRTWKDWTTFTLSYQNCNNVLMFPSRLLYAYHMYEKYENFKSTKKILQYILANAKWKNPRVPPSWPNSERQFTLAHQSAALGHVDICKQIMKSLKYPKDGRRSSRHRWDPRDKWGRTPLHIAAENLEEEVCSMLMFHARRQRWDLPRDYKGDNPLHLMARNTSCPIEKALRIVDILTRLASNSDDWYWIKNYAGESCVDVARKELRKYLKKHGLSSSYWIYGETCYFYDSGGRIQGDLDISWNVEIPDPLKEQIKRRVQMVKILETASEHYAYQHGYFEFRNGPEQD